MSVEAMLHVWSVEAPSPLAKLVLVKFADSGDGSGAIDVYRYAEFCCCSPQEVQQAVSSLLDAGLLGYKSAVHMEYLLLGYQPEDKRPRSEFKSVYQKRTIGQGLRMRVFERDGFTCCACGAKQSLTVDHIHPESKGGTLDPSNLQTLCRPCNSKKGARHE